MVRERILGVFKLQANVFASINSDPGAGFQSALIVALVAVLLALRSRISPLFGDLGVAANFFIAVAWTFFSWVLWAGIIYYSGRLLTGRWTHFGQLLAVTGFAYAPQALAILPWFGALAGAIWSLVAGFVAIRQVLEVDNRRAALIMLLGFGVYIGGVFLVAEALNFVRQSPV